MLEGQPSNHEEPKKNPEKKGFNIFEKIGRMDKREMGAEIDGILKAELQRDIKWFNFAPKAEENTPNESAQFLEELGKYTERAISLTEEISRHVEAGTAHLLAVGEDNPQAVGFFIPLTGEENKHIISFDNGELYTAEPKNPESAERYKKMMDNDEISFPEILPSFNGKVSGSVYRKIIGILGEDKYGIKVTRGDFEKAVEVEYQKARKSEKEEAKEKETAQLAEEVFRSAEALINKTRYESFNSKLDAMNESRIPKQSKTENAPKNKKKEETL